MTISAINLGNTFTNVNGTPVTGGLESGLNTSSIINSLVSAQTTQVTQLQDQITVGSNKGTALSTLNELLTELQQSTEALASPQSPDSSSNVFALRSTEVSGNTTQSASNYVTASASALASMGNYTISNISQIATATIQETNSFSVANANTSVVASSPAAGMFSAGTFYVNGVAITLTAGETLNQVAAAFNSANSGPTATGIAASVLETSSGEYSLVFTGANTGLANAFNLNTATSTNSINVSSPTAATSGQIAAGTYTINGQSVTITSDESLQDIAAAFSGTGITANVVNTGTDEYQIQFGGDVAGLSGNTSNFDLITTSTNAISIASADTATTGQIAAGTYTINGQSVVITSGETLDEIADGFNSANSGSTPSGIAASVVSVGAGQYELQFTGNTSALNTYASALDLNTGTLSNTSDDASGALSGITFTTVQSAQDAKFEFDGIQVDRASNTISDLVAGVTFNLLQNTVNDSGATITVAVQPDTDSIEDAVQSFVTDYNSILTFYAEQTQFDTTTGAPASTAYLSSDTTLSSIYSQLSSFAASVVSGAASGSSTLQDLGISFSNQAATGTAPAIDNLLTVNATTLTSAIQNNLSSIEDVFGYNATSSSSDLEVYTPPQNTAINNFAINSDGAGNYTATYTLNGQQQTVNLIAESITDGVALTAPTSSALNGLIVIYSGSTSSPTSINITSTNGIASQMYTLATSATETNTGLIAVDQQAISTQTTTLQTQITNVDNQISTTRQQLLTKFSALESAIAEANSSLDFLNAQQLAQSSSS